MEIRNNYQLSSYNSFGVKARANKFIVIQDEKDLWQLDGLSEVNPIILGAGSNVLIAKSELELVYHIDIKGIKIIKDEEAYVLVEVGAGENWHSFVLWTLDNDFGGIENLALIPGNVGAAPMQNIGAYGVELKDVFHSLWGYNVEKQKMQSFHKNECQFGYRESIFKSSYKDKFIITKVVLRLNKALYHKSNISYGAIAGKLKEKGISGPSISEVAETVIEIRQSKLPDPKSIGNAGSFFKNPILPTTRIEKLRESWPDIPSFQTDDPKLIKVPAAWLIEKSGWKGHRAGECGCYEKHALVLVNYGNATGRQIIELSRKIQASVLEKFEIELIPEVNLID